MRIERLLLEFAVCCAITAGLVHRIPAGYRVAQIYALSGNTGPPAEVPARLTSAVRSALGGPWGTAPLRCSAGPAADRWECSATLPRRSEALSLGEALRRVIPARVGWIPADGLRGRMEETQARLRAWNAELASLVKEYASLEIRTAEAEKGIGSLRARKAPLENDLANRKRQLEILAESASSDAPEATRRRYEAKKTDVARIIGELQARIDAIDAEIVSLSSPLERRNKITESLPGLRSRIDLARAEIDSWKPLLASSAKASWVADPGGFQVAPLDGKAVGGALRSWGHLPWSLPLGGLLFAILRRKRLSEAKSRFFRSPEEVTEATGLPCLGEI